jgi:hypothetical protein
MNVAVRDITLPKLIDRASQALLGAKTSAEILEAKDLANIAYHTAKATARIAKARNAHDNVVAAAHRAQADALEIEALAKRRLADEYDAAQERGELGKRGDYGTVTSEGEVTKATAADIGITHKVIHEARKIRDAEERSPGIIRSALDAMLKSRTPPSRAELRRAVLDDDDEEDDAPPRKKDAFLVFANEALLLAKYDGPVDSEVIEAAKATASAWCRLVSIMEQGK